VIDMALRVAIPDLVSPSYFPAIAAVELGLFRREGLDATLELIYPVTKTYAELREGRLDFVGGAAHAALYAFEGWEGGKLVCALAQRMYWFLVLRADLGAKRGELQKIKGLRIGAAPGPVDGLRQMLREAGIDPERDVQIGPVPAPIGAGVSFGVTAARALATGQIDGFWANGMAAEVSVRNGAGTLVIDARRGDGPPAAPDYTFSALVTTQRKIDEEPAIVAAAVRAIVGAHAALKDDPERATAIGRKLFAETEASLIAELVRRDLPFYDPAISEATVEAMNRFARGSGLLSEPVPYEQVVATQFRNFWSG
jgi:ABC-type nitrate/sulfonate/bicarbonate transport system substrate-binding protein